MKLKYHKFVLGSLFAALIFCATYIIKIPTLTGGYVHLGDGFVIIAGWMLGPIFGPLAAGIGSALSDLLGGYPQYILPTFIIKGLMAFIAAMLNTAMSKGRGVVLKRIISAICAEILMVAGYYFIEATIMSYGFAGAIVGVLPNAVQAIFGVISSILIYQALSVNKRIKEYLNLH